jgi:hypothetical protein
MIVDLYRVEVGMNAIKDVVDLLGEFRSAAAVNGK